MKNYNLALNTEELYVIYAALSVFRDINEDMANDDECLEQQEAESAVLIIEELMDDIDMVLYGSIG